MNEAAAGDGQRTQVCHIVDAETGRSTEVEGLLYRLIVRLHRYSLGRHNYFDRRHWKTGMILDNGPNGHAFIEEIAGDVQVTVRAAYPERFLHLLCEEVRWLIDHFWKGLHCQFAVPCDSPCKGLLGLQEMFDNLNEGIPKVRCPVCRKYHLVADKMATLTNPYCETGYWTTFPILRSPVKFGCIQWRSACGPCELEPRQREIVRGCKLDLANSIAEIRNHTPRNLGLDR